MLFISWLILGPESARYYPVSNINVLYCTLYKSTKSFLAYWQGQSKIPSKQVLIWIPKRPCSIFARVGLVRVLHSTWSYWSSYYFVAGISCKFACPRATPLALMTSLFCCRTHRERAWPELFPWWSASHHLLGWRNLPGLRPQNDLICAVVYFVEKKFINPSLYFQKII
jgi:hypothetical protein